MEQRQEEAFALSSIYESDFSERIPNQVWTLRLKLSHINKSLKEAQKNEKKKSAQRAQDTRRRKQNICNFYKEGSCRFGSKCKFFHEATWDNDGDNEFEDMMEDDNTK